MNGTCWLCAVIFLCIVLDALNPMPSLAQTPQPPRQYLYGDPGPMTIERALGMLGPAGCGNITQADAITLVTAREKERRLYRVPLHYETCDFLLSELDSAIVPDDGPMAVRAGDTVRYPFGIAGVSAIIPDHRSNSLLILCNANGYNNLKMFTGSLDVPVRNVTPASLLPTATSITPQVDAVNIPSVAAEVTADEPVRAYYLSLTYTTPDFILDELNQSYVPDSGLLVLKPGEVARNNFKIDGVRLIIPNRQDNSLLIVCTPDGFKTMQVLVRMLDIPAVSLPGKLSPSKSGRSGK